jgi:hypothetical protein
VDHPIHRTGLDAARPGGERHDSRAAFIERSFAVAVGAIVARNLDLGNVTLAGEHGIPGAAIVAVEDDERIITLSLFVERVE